MIKEYDNNEYNDNDYNDNDNEYNDNQYQKDNKNIDYIICFILLLYFYGWYKVYNWVY